MSLHALLQGLVIDTDTEIRGGSADVHRGAAAPGAVIGDDNRAFGHAAVELVCLDLLHNLLHVQIAVLIIAGNINPGDVGGFIRPQMLEQRGKGTCPLVPGQLRHGLKGPAAVARHGHAHAHILEEAVFTALIAHADI